jgi:hypothetical protein
MTKTFALKSAVFDGTSYQLATAEVDEEARILRLSYRKKSFIKTEEVFLGNIAFDEQSSVRSEGQKTILGDTEMEAASSNDAIALTEILTAPLRVALDALREIIAGPMAGFLTTRAETLGLLANLKSDYRRAILRCEKLVPMDSRDPLSDIIRTKAEELERLLGLALTSLDGFFKDKPSESEKAYAFLLALCLMQDAKLAGEEGLDTVLQMLGGLGVFGTSNIKQLPVEEATQGLVKLAVSQPQLFF